MAGDKRPNAGANAVRPKAQHLGAFRRELLLHLAIRDATHRIVHLQGKGRRRFAFRWSPSRALQPQVELTPTLAAKTSAAMRALEELGLIVRIRGANEIRSRAVYTTGSGIEEAVDILERQGCSPTEASKSRDYLGNRFHADPLELALDLLERERPNLFTLLVWSDYGQCMSLEQARHLWWLGRIRGIQGKYLRKNRDALDPRAVDMFEEIGELVEVVDQADPADVYLYQFAREITTARARDFRLPQWVADFQVFDLAPGLPASSL